MELFQNAGDSNEFFAKSYGYAVFPTIGKGGFGIGGARGKGRVFVGGNHVGNTTMTQDEPLFQVGQVIVAAGAVLSLAALVVRFQRSSGQVREQFKWVVWGASVFVPLAVMSMLLDASDLEGLETGLLMVGGVDYSWGQGTETAFLDYVAPFLFNK